MAFLVFAIHKFVIQNLYSNFFTSSIIVFSFHPVWKNTVIVHYESAISAAFLLGGARQNDGIGLSTKIRNGHKIMCENY